MRTVGHKSAPSIPSGKPQSDRVICLWLGALLALGAIGDLQPSAAQAPPGAADGASWDSAPAPAKRPEGATYVPGQVLAGLVSSEFRASVLAGTDALGYTLAGEVPRQNLLKLRCETGREQESLAELRRLPGIAFAATNAYGEAWAS